MYSSVFKPQVESAEFCIPRPLAVYLLQPFIYGSKLLTLFVKQTLGDSSTQHSELQIWLWGPLLLFTSNWFHISQNLLGQRLLRSALRLMEVTSNKYHCTNGHQPDRQHINGGCIPCPDTWLTSLGLNYSAWGNYRTLIILSKVSKNTFVTHEYTWEPQAETLVSYMGLDQHESSYGTSLLIWFQGQCHDSFD